MPLAPAPVLDVPRPAAPGARASLRPRTCGRLGAESAQALAPEASPARQVAQLLDALPVGVATIDRDYHIRTINLAARRLLGIHTTGIGEDLIHRVAPSLAGPLRLALDAALRGESTSGSYRVTEDLVEDQGRDLAVSCFPAEPDQAEDGLGLAVLAVEDCTEQTERERALEAKRARLQAELVRQAARATAAVAEIRDLRGANQAMAAVNARLRADNEELLVANEEAQAAAEEIETLNEELQATNEELETLNEELHATVEGLTTTNDELQARSLDLQELAAARETERGWLAAVLAGIGDAVLVVDRHGAPILTNAAYQRFFDDSDLPAEDEAGEPLPPEALPQQRAARGETFAMTFALSGSNHGRRWFEATGQPLQHNGAGRGVVTIRDITDRSLRQLLDQWLAMTSDELRTPLAALLGALQMVERRPDDAERRRRFLAQAAEQARRIGALIGELVDTVRLQSGRLWLDRAPVELGAVVRRAVNMARLVARGQEIRLEATAEAATLVGDAGRLEQVLLNLLTNAVTYAAGTDRINVRLWCEGDEAVVAVQDYGPGIPAADLDRIFSRYYQSDRPTGEVNAGLGLGLFIAREIVTAHDGSIVADSTVGEGTTFTIRLPLAADAAAGAVDRGGDTGSESDREEDRR